MLLLGLTFCVLGAALAGPAVPVSSKNVLDYKNFLEKFTKRDDEVTLKERMAANPKANPWENSGKYQGDILLDNTQVQGMVSSLNSRKAYIWPDTKWPQNTVVYEIAPGHFNAQQRAAIAAAINDITRHTCVRFRLRRPGDTAFVRLTNFQDGCYAHVGYWQSRGVHIHNLADNCFWHAIIIHEWLHNIGFVHMQSTYNRDNYVRVLWENMEPGIEFNFDKYTPDVVSQLGLPYEYWSTMHYSRYAGSRNGHPTLLPLFNDFGLMGQIDFISPTDWHRVNRHYNCPGAWN